MKPRKETFLITFDFRNRKSSNKALGGVIVHGGLFGGKG